MPRSYLGPVSAALAGFSFVTALYSQSASFQSPRAEGWKLAQALIRESASRKGIPVFVSWATAREIFPCGSRPHALPAGASTRNLLDESFHYSPEAADRMCVPLADGIAAPLDAARALWEQSGSSDSATLRFPDGAHLAAAFWNAVRRPSDAMNGKIVQMAVRSGDD